LDCFNTLLNALLIFANSAKLNLPRLLCRTFLAVFVGLVGIGWGVKRQERDKEKCGRFSARAPRLNFLESITFMVSGRSDLNHRDPGRADRRKEFQPRGGRRKAIGIGA
jgi:hypothetical protein